MKRTKILLGLSAANAANRDILRGVHRFAVQRDQWVFRYEPDQAFAVKWSKTNRPAGAIVKKWPSGDLRRLRALKIPVVNLDSPLPDTSVSQVRIDYRAVGALAAQHLMEQGFTQLAFAGEYKPPQNEAITRGFVQNAADAGIIVHELPKFRLRLEKAKDWDPVATMKQWLLSLPTPIGMGCISDSRAWWVSEACMDLGIRIPEQIALMGATNDENYCTLSCPPLTSIELPWERLGYEAMSHLNDLIQRKGGKPIDLILPPTRVVRRQSTDIYAVEDSVVVQALGYIRDHACDPIAVMDVVRHVCVSRRNLEERFQAAVGCTPAAQIRRIQVIRARDLIVSTTLPFSEICIRSGMRTPQQLCNFLKRELGLTPTEMRRGDHSSQK